METTNKTMVYNANNGNPLRIINSDDACITKMKDHEDFMPLSMWIEGGGKIENVPTV